MSYKRTHDVFATGSNGMDVVGTSWVPPVAQPPRKKPKAKTEAKKRYLAKKARKHKKLVKARRDAAPKNKVFNPSQNQDGQESGSEDDDEPTVPESDIPRVTENAIAGPSRIPAPVEQKEETKSSTDIAVKDEDEEAAKEQRKREKKEKRENRDRSERRRRREERGAKALGLVEGDTVQNQESQEQSLKPSEPFVGKIAETNVGSEESGDEQQEFGQPQPSALDEIDLGRELSPPLLEAFPLPTPAPAPDPALLSRQGLPAGLEDATLIDENLKVDIEEIEITRGDKAEKGVGSRMAKRLKDMGITEFFAVQTAILPQLMPLPLVPTCFDRVDDYLISAPTGSGKTLAYTIPIINVLESRNVTRLRALIILPTRDLVVQVRETMEALAKGTGLTIGSVTGQHGFAHEQNQLVADKETKLLGGSSKIDILIATPGRLIDHLDKTPNFTLQHLRFLIIDEADRLLNQSFHDWLARVLSHIRPPTHSVQLSADFVRKPWDLVASNWQESFGMGKTKGEWSLPPAPTCQKLLFSATLTRDPAAIASLHLTNPQYFIVQTSSHDTIALGESFALPSTLTERYLVLPPALKPLNLIHLLHDPAFSVGGALVFTKSVENVTRLVSLLEKFEKEYQGGLVVKGYTSEMRPSDRRTLLSDFSAGKIDLLVCSDVIARGLDLPSVSHVISYDTPVDMRKYVHRVGRTARAGREGTAWTLVEKQEALHFKGMLRDAGRDNSVKKIKVKEDSLAPYRDAYQRAMGTLKEQYARHD